MNYEHQIIAQNHWAYPGSIASDQHRPLSWLHSSSASRYPRRVIVVRPYSPFRDPFGRSNRYNYYRQYVFSNSDKAYEQGYEDGRKTGESDGRKSKSYDPERSHYYQDAGFGNFAEAYRNGFNTGYGDGFKGQAIG